MANKNQKKLSVSKPKISIQNVETDVETNPEVEKAEGWFSNLSTGWKWTVIVGAIIIIMLFFKACL